MTTNFPTTLDSYTTKANNIDTIQAAHVNNLQDAVVAIETLLGADSARRTAWTPSFVWATPGSSSWTYGSTRVGWYAKFGSLVWISAFVQATPTIGTGSGQLYMTGLPFTLPTTAGGFYPISVSNCSGFTTYPTNGLIWQNTDQMRFYRSSNVADTLTTSHVTTGTQFQILLSAFYFDV